MRYDVKTITKWKAPSTNGAPLLCMPNVPKPLHLVNPRNIMGEYQWGKVRRVINQECNYTCQASGEELGKGKTHVHEVYNVDYQTHTLEFVRAVPLDPLLHTTIIHSGRALTLFQNNDPQMTADKMLAGLEKGFKLIADWNQVHPDEGPLRAFSVILKWAEHPYLKDRVNDLIKKYDIKFYDVDDSSINKHNWSKWKLIYDGKEYGPKFANHQEWGEHFKRKEAKEPVGGEAQELNVLDNILKEEYENS